MGCSIETVNLSELAGSSFNPYVIERNEFWIVLPVLGFLLIVVHLIKVKKKKGSS